MRAKDGARERGGWRKHYVGQARRFAYGNLFNCALASADNHFALAYLCSEPCGARKRDCNTFRGLVSNGNETLASGSDSRSGDWERAFFVYTI